MKKLLLLCFVGSMATPAMANDVARVVSVQPEYTTFTEQRCTYQTVESNNSGTGAVIVAITGGVVGNHIGNGSGKDVATVLGVIVGANVGNRIGTDQKNYEQRKVCNNYPITRHTGDTVTFEYRGRQFTVSFDR